MAALRALGMALPNKIPSAAKIIRPRKNHDPVAGIPACARVHKDIDILWHETPARYAEALSHTSGVLPVMIPPMGPASLIGATEIMVNSLHGQAVNRPAPGMEIEAMAPNGTIEAIWVASAPGFALGVQWHPEWRYDERPGSMTIFKAFGDACRTGKPALRKAA